MRNPIISVVAVAALAAGCVTQHPQTAQEFREAVAGSRSATTETFTVNRAFRDVAKTFKQKGPQCLHGTIRTASGNSVIVAEYNPTVVVTAKRAELDLQRHYLHYVVHLTHEPKGGYYLLVADAYPAGRNRTRIQIFRPSFGFTPLIQAIRNWASGKNYGCPDMTKL